MALKAPVASDSLVEARSSSALIQRQPGAAAATAAGRARPAGLMPELPLCPSVAAAAAAAALPARVRIIPEDVQDAHTRWARSARAPRAAHAQVRRNFARALPPSCARLTHFSHLQNSVNLLRGST